MSAASAVRAPLSYKAMCSMPTANPCGGGQALAQEKNRMSSMDAARGARDLERRRCRDIPPQ
ncbi:MAG TPA: hypothetical protein VME42_15985 [Steroidobacteraceae bacterium]|nr:hypothetical protein [Steroidobacteraceae bacterium]